MSGKFQQTRFSGIIRDLYNMARRQMHRQAAPICRRLAFPAVPCNSPEGGPVAKHAQGPRARRAGSHARLASVSLCELNIFSKRCDVLIIL